MERILFKKISLIWCLILFLCFFVFLVFFGSALRGRYVDNVKEFYPEITRYFHFISMMPELISSANFSGGQIQNNKDLPDFVLVDESFQSFREYKNDSRNAILVLSRYDGDRGSSVVDLVDLNNWKTIHTYSVNLNDFQKLLGSTPLEDVENFKLPAQNRARIFHPIIGPNGELIADFHYSPLFKINLCSELIWANFEKRFHHSHTFDGSGNIWVPTIKNTPKTDLHGVTEATYRDEELTKVDADGKIIESRSLAEILLKNNVVGEGLLRSGIDPLHTNDIEEALYDTPFWKSGDLFISIKYLSAIIHYRPNQDKVIQVIKGPFWYQHDVDLHPDGSLTIFNNNTPNILGEVRSNVLKYDFQTKSFSVMFTSMNFITRAEGLHQILSDGAMLVESQRQGKLMLFDEKGDLLWSYTNVDSKKRKFTRAALSWASVIEDPDHISSIKKNIESLKCEN